MPELPGATVESPVLVTGMHKAGTTWVGRVLSRRQGVGYIHEPFNLNGPAGVCQAPFRYWYTYICEENEPEFLPHLTRVLRFRYNVSAEIQRLSSGRDAARMVRDCALFLRHRMRGAQPLVKDPIASLSAEWLARTFDMQVVVVTRHPAAFAGSLKIREANHPFSHFLDQPLLMRDHLMPLEREIRRLAERPGNAVEQATLLWRVIYGVLLEFGRRHPEWIFVRHEDLCADPLGEYETLYERLGWNLDGRTRDWISRSSGLRKDGMTAARRIGRDRFIYRESSATRESWKRRLTSAEIAYVRERTQADASEFYSVADWE